MELKSADQNKKIKRIETSKKTRGKREKKKKLMTSLPNNSNLVSAFPNAFLALQTYSP